MKALQKDRNKTIWILWYQGYQNAPEIVKLCMDSWTRWNPEYKVVVLDKTSLREIIHLPDSVSPEKRQDINHIKYSNLCRLEILAKYGGIWVDATVFCCKKLDDWLPDYYTTGFFAFRNPGPDRMMSTWFIAAEPNSIILKTLHREMMQFYQNNTFKNQNNPFSQKLVRKLTPIFSSNLKRTLLWQTKLFIKLFKIYPYFIFHYIFNKIMIKNRVCKEIWSNGKVYAAESPHRLQLLEDRDCQESIKKAIQEIDSRETPVYKLNWKVDTQNEYWTSVVNCLKRKCCKRV